MDVFDVFASFNLLDNITGPLGKIRKAFGLTESAGGRLSSKMAALTKSLLPFVAAAGLFLVSLAPAVGVAANFQSAISGVGAVSRANAAEMRTLEQAAQDLGASTAWSASQVASAEKSLAMAGFAVAENVAALPGVLDLASAAQHDLGDTANIASNILSSFSMEASQMGKVADILTTTFTSSNTTLASLSSTMANAGPVAAAAGASLAEVAAMAGKLGDVGIDASVAGTGIKIMFQRLQAPVGEATKALSSLGVVTKDASGDMLPIFNILGSLESALDGMGSADKAAYLQKIFGAEAVGPIQALMTQGIDTIRAYSASLEQPGAAAQVATRQLDNFNGATTILGSGFEALEITIGKIFLPVLTALVKGITAVVNWINALAGNPIGRFFVAFAAAIAGVVVAMGIFSAGLWAATVAAGALNLTMLANPVVLVGAALVAAAVLILSYWTEIKQFFISLWQPIQNFIDKAEAAYHLFMGIWRMDGLGAAFSDLWASLSDGIKDAFLWDEITGFFSNIWNAVGDFVDEVASAFDSFMSIWRLDGIKDAFSNLWNGLPDGLRDVLDFMYRLFMDFSPVGLMIKAVNAIVDYFANVDLSECGQKLWTTFTSGIKSMISAPVEIFKSGLQKLRNMLPFSDAKEGPLSTLTLSGQRMMQTLAGGVGTGAGSLVDAVSGALSLPGKLVGSGIGALSVPVEFASNGPEAVDDFFLSPFTTSAQAEVVPPANQVESVLGPLTLPVELAAKGLDAVSNFFGPAPAFFEPAPAGAPSLASAEPRSAGFGGRAVPGSQRTASKSSGITIQSLTLNVSKVADLEDFVRQLQGVVSRYDT